LVFRRKQPVLMDTFDGSIQVVETPEVADDEVAVVRLRVSYQGQDGRVHFQSFSRSGLRRHAFIYRITAYSALSSTTSTAWTLAVTLQNSAIEEKDNQSVYTGEGKECLTLLLLFLRGSFHRRLL
jgi:hypothetical protein